MFLSAVSVLVVAQSSSEILEGLMNNPVYAFLKISASWDVTSCWLIGTNVSEARGASVDRILL